jgi:anti-sigma factor RsiW
LQHPYRFLQNQICRNEALLSAFLDGELDNARMQQIRSHLDSCAPCRERLAALVATDKMIQAADGIEPSADFERIFWRTVSELEQRPAPFAWKRWLQPGWRPAIAIGLAAGILFGIMMLTGPRQDMSLEEMFLADNIEFLEEYDVIRHLDILENWDALEAMKERS